MPCSGGRPTGGRILPISVAAAVTYVHSRSAFTGMRWDTVTVGAVGGRLDRISFAHGRILAEIGVTCDGREVASEYLARIRVLYGDPIAYEPGCWPNWRCCSC
jgi:hypothetical protein